MQLNKSTIVIWMIWSFRDWMDQMYFQMHKLYHINQLSCIPYSTLGIQHTASSSWDKPGGGLKERTMTLQICCSLIFSTTFWLVWAWLWRNEMILSSRSKAWGSCPTFPILKSSLSTRINTDGWVLWKKVGFPVCLHYSLINITSHWILC